MLKFLSSQRFSTLPPIRPLVPTHINILYTTCTYNRLPEDETSSSEHVEESQFGHGIVQCKTDRGTSIQDLFHPNS